MCKLHHRSLLFSCRTTVWRIISLLLCVNYTTDVCSSHTERLSRGSSRAVVYKLHHRTQLYSRRTTVWRITLAAVVCKLQHRSLLFSRRTTVWRIISLPFVYKLHHRSLLFSHCMTVWRIISLLLCVNYTTDLCSSHAARLSGGSSRCCCV